MTRPSQPHPPSRPRRSVIDELDVDAIDAELAQPWLVPPADFAERVMSACRAMPAAPRPGRRLMVQVVLLIAGVGGLIECLSYLAGLWLVASVAP